MTKTALVLTNASENTKNAILRVLADVNPDDVVVATEQEAEDFHKVVVVGAGGPAHALRLEDAATFPESAVAALIRGLAIDRQVSEWQVADLPKGGILGSFKQTPTGQWAVLEGPNPNAIQQRREGRTIQVTIPLSGEWRLVPTWVTAAYP